MRQEIEPKELEARLTVAQQLARDAGREALRRQFGNLSVVEKERLGDIVTSSDFTSQAIIIQGIQQNFPQDGIWSEELSTATEGKLRWVIDPIDGTLPYRTGIEEWGVSIGIHDEGGIVCGVVYLPVYDRVYHATRGGGAFCNGQPIHSPQKLNMRQWPFLLTFGYMNTTEDIQKDADLKKRFLEKGLQVATFYVPGCTTMAICQIAEGKKGSSYLHTFATPFDLGAAPLVLTEAGGVFSKIDWTKKRQPFLAAVNQALYDQVLEILGEDFINKIGLRP